ncbi:MAG TPA: fibronectin type III domain-containing protein [Solirubrobacterales bacterium]|nr:fibronectin type III domain-containing protein [Solirubrobacterales bacterium]
MLSPASALAIGGEQKLDDPPTMGYTTMHVTGLVKADLTSFTGAVVEVAESPSGFSDGAINGGGELPLSPGEEVVLVDKTFTDLEPGTTYYARIKGERFGGDGPTFSNVVSGTTLPVDPPAVLGVDDASSLSYVSAHVSGEVEGVEGPDAAFASNCRFEYVSDAEYGARNEVQVLTVRATGGTFQLNYDGGQTGPLAHDASAATVEAAIEALPAVGAGNVSVSGGPGDAGGDNPYTVAFQGTLAGADLGQISVEASGLEPGGQSGADVQTSVGGHPAEGFDRARSVPCDVDPVTSAGPTAVSADLTGLEAGTTYHLRLAISNAGGGDSEEASDFTTLAVDPPAVLGVDDAGDVLYTQADVSGEVERPVGSDPAFDVDCRFEFVTASSFLSEGFQSASQQPCAESPLTGAGSSAVSAHLSGLGVGATYYYRLVAVNAGGKDVVRGTNPFTTLVPDAPEVSIFPVDQIGTHSARFSGEINPGDTDPGFDVNWHFECSPECPGLEGSIPADDADHEVSVEATGLSANTEYQVTLVAGNAAQSASAGPVGFSTDAAAPVVVTFPAFALAGGTEAFVGGTVDAENSPSTYWIEYGSDDSYGSVFPVGEDGDAGSGDSPGFVRERLTGLEPGAEYHYRLVAGNGVGSTPGRDMSFVTPAGDLGSSIGSVELPDDRAWEMVSPPQKNSSEVWRAYVGASADGQAISYRSQGSFAGLPTAKGANLADYRAVRGSTGWTTEGLTPPGGLYSFTSGAFEMSDDKRFTRFNWRERGNESPDEDLELDPDQVGSVVRQYLRNNQTKKFKLIPFPVEGSQGVLPYASSTDNGHYSVTTVENVTEEVPCDAEAAPCVYESLDHGFTWRLASVLPDESPAQATLAAISQDGSRIYFRSGDANYVRVDGSTTTQVSGAGGTTVVAIEGGSGERALLRSSEQLLGADEDLADDLYVWDGSEPEGERLTLVSQGDRPGVEVELDRVLGHQEDMINSQRLDRGFFVANNQVLTGEDGAPGQKIYAWDATGSQPSLAYVATANPADARTSPNGRFLVFASTERLTAYDNAGQQEVYRYDQAADRLVCVSCEPEGRTATAEGRLYYIAPPEVTFGLGHAQRNVTDTGLVFFESLERLSRHDSNGESDVYEYSEGLPYLLSKGTGPHESRLGDASVSGDDVFILTADRLSGWDSDRSYDVYDARVGGGLPEPPVGGIPCEGDSCQPPPNPPNDPTPASENFRGAGSVKPQRAKKPCKRAKGKKKPCKKKHKKHGKKRPTPKNG